MEALNLDLRCVAQELFIISKYEVATGSVLCAKRKKLSAMSSELIEGLCLSFGRNKIPPHPLHKHHASGIIVLILKGAQNGSEAPDATGSRWIYGQQTASICNSSGSLETLFITPSACDVAY